VSALPPRPRVPEAYLPTIPDKRPLLVGISVSDRADAETTLKSDGLDFFPCCSIPTDCAKRPACWQACPTRS
jgi:hypothetical protein